MLCTSGFVDDVSFSHNGLYGAVRWESVTLNFAQQLKTSKYSTWVVYQGRALFVLFPFLKFVFRHFPVSDLPLRFNLAVAN